MRKGARRAMCVALLAIVAAGLAPSATMADPLAGSRTEAEITGMDLSAIVAALEEDRAVLTYYLAELHRRHPDEVEQPDLTGLPPLDPASAADLAAADDDRIADSVEVVSAEIDRLIARGTLVQAGAQQAVPAAQPSHAAPASATAAPATEEKPYCYRMYGQAYSLCASDDRSCKMFAANDYGICKKTGRWP